MKEFFKFLFVAFSILLIAITKTYAASVEPVQLNGFGNIERFIIDPDSNYVVYNAFGAFDFLNRFSRKIDGSSGNIPLASNFPATSVFSNFLIDNNSRVISRVDNPSTGNKNFLSILIDGSNPTLLPAPLTSPGNVSSFSITGESNRIAFNTTSGGGLFSIPNDGSEPAIDLSSSIDPNGNVDVGRIRQTLDSNTVVFDAELDAIREEALFSVPIDGSQDPTRLSPLNDSKVDNFSVAPNLGTVVYVEEVGDDESDTFQQQIFSVAIDGSSDPIPLTGLITGSFNIIEFKISPDSQRVVFTTINETLNQAQLFSVPVDGSSTPILIDEGNNIYQFEITNNNEKIIYTVERLIAPNAVNFFVPVLFSSSLVPFNSEEPMLLSSTFPTSGFALVNTDAGFELSSDSEFVFFIQERIPFFNGSIGELTRVSINNPTTDFITLSITTLDDSQPLGLDDDIIAFEQDVLDFALSNDESFIIYNSTPNLFTLTTLDNGVGAISVESTNTRLSKVSTDGSNILKLNTTDNDVLDFQISNNDEVVVFTAGIQDNFSNLFSLNIDEPEPLCFPIRSQNDNFVTICL